MIDTHCHLNDDYYNEDLHSVISNYLQAGVSVAVCVGYDLPSSLKAEKIARENPSVYYAIGVHPDNCHLYNESEIEQAIKQGLNSHSKLVAVGEIGLDYFHNKENKQEQKEVFISQIKLAKKYNLPIIIHCREAYGDVLEILKEYAPISSGAVMHCYGGSLEYAKELMRLGVKISFTGTVTFKNAVNVKEVAKNIPLNDLFFETDCPYLTPEPNRGKRNEPKYVVDVLKYVAKLRDMDEKELELLTNKNAKDFFKIT